MGKQQTKSAVSGTLEVTPQIMNEADMAGFEKYLLDKGYNRGDINQMQSAHNEAMQQLQPEKNLGVSATEYKMPNQEYQKSVLSDIGTGFYNSFVDLAEGVGTLVPTIAQASGSDNKFWDAWQEGVTNWADGSKGMLSDAANKPLSDDWFNLNAWGAGLGQGLGFIASMSTGGGLIGKAGQAAGITSNAVKAKRIGNFISGTMSMTPAIYKEGIDAGLSKANAARMSLGLSGLISMTEGAALEWMGKAIAKPIATNEAKAAFKESLGKFSTKGLTEESFNEVMKLTGLNFSKRMKALGTKAFESSAIEGMQEFSQTYIEEGVKELYDTVVAPGKEKGEGAYGADVLSAETFNNALSSGLLGGFIGGGLATKGSMMGGVKGETLFGYVNNAVKTNDKSKMQELGTLIQTMAAEGKLADSPDAIIEHISKIKNFTDQTKGLDIPSGTAKYQLFQMMEMEKAMSDKIGQKYSVDESTHPAVAKAYKKNIKLAELVSGALNEDIKQIIENKEPLDKNREKFETTLSKYVALYKGIVVGAVDEEVLNKLIPKTSYAVKEQLKEEKKAEKAKENAEVKTEVKEETAKPKTNSTESVENVADIPKIEPLSETEVKSFKETGEVTDERLTDIVRKITKGEKLTDDERAISNDPAVSARKAEILTKNNFGEQQYAKSKQNAIQEQRPTQMGTHKGGSKGPGGANQSGRMGQSKQGKETADKGKKEAQVTLASGLSERQVKINNIHQKIAKFNNLKNGRLGKTKSEGVKLHNEIMNDVRELGDENIRLANRKTSLVLKNKNGNGLRPVTPHLQNRGKAESHTPLENRNDNVKEVFHALNEGGVHHFPVIRGTDGKRMSKKQVASAINDVVEGNPSNGAEQLLNQLEEAITKNEFTYANAGMDVTVPLKDVLESSKMPGHSEEVHDELTDEDEYVLAQEWDEWFKSLSEKEQLKELKRLGYGNTEKTDTEGKGQENASDKEAEMAEVKAREQRKSVEDTRELISQNPELYNRIKEQFQYVFPSLPIQEIDNMLWTYGADVLARISKEGIQINKDTAVQNSIIHEYAHAYIDLVGQDSPLVKLGLDQIKGTKYMEWAKENYPEMSETDQAMEALVEAVSQDSLKKLKTKFEGTSLDKFLLWAKTFWNKVRGMLNLNNADTIVETIAQEMNTAENLQQPINNQPRQQRQPSDPNIKYQTVNDISNGILKQSTTKELLKDNPALAKRIIDRLRNLYPGVVINDKGLFDENGQWTELPADKAGMAYRNGLLAAVAWSNDSFLETPPHEFAHIYVDMFRNVPMVQKALKGYGSEEALVEKMGEYFADRETSTTFQKWVADFWAMVRSFFGNPDVGQELFDAFYQGKQLAPEENMGTGIYNYQERGQPYTRLKDTDTFDTSGFSDLEESAAEMMPVIQAEKELLASIAPDPERGFAKSSTNFIQQKFQGIIRRLYTYVDLNDRNNEYSSVAGLSMNDLERAHNELGSDKSVSAIAQYLEGKITRDQLDRDQQETLDILTRAYQRSEYKKRLDKAIYTTEGKLMPLEKADQIVRSEITNTEKRKEELYNGPLVKKLKLRKVLQATEKFLSHLRTPRLDAKWISGSEASFLSKVFYDSLNAADSKYKDIVKTFDNFLVFHQEKGAFRKWSTFNTPKQNIDYYDGHTFEFDVKSNDENGQPQYKKGKVKLTKNEMLTLYMNLRQNEAEIGMDPALAIRNNGFFLKDHIEGREGKATDQYIFPRTEQEIQDKVPSQQELDFMKMIESDAQMMEIVDQIDKSMEYMKSKVDPIFKAEQGYDLKNIKNYFPVYASEASTGVNQKKNSIEEFRAGKERTGANKPLMIGDLNDVLNSHKNNGALYASHSQAVSNNRKIIETIKKDYKNTQTGKYLEQMEGLLNNLEDSSLLYSSQGEKDWEKFMNRMTNNFAISVLGMNIFSMVKQTVGLLSVRGEIDPKYFKKAGLGPGGILSVSPGKMMKMLTVNGTKGETWFPVEWRADSENPTYKTIKEHSPKLSWRIEGAISRESGEALMDASAGQDYITLPFKDKNGDPLRIQKSRFLEGMKAVDNAVVMGMWKTVEMETQDRFPELPVGSKEYYDHVARRTEDLITKTQGSSEPINRPALARSKNPFAKFITMFGSQSSALGALIIDGTLSYINNPSKENKAKLLKRYSSILVYSSIALATIDALKHALLYGFDDDDEIPGDILMGSTLNAMSNFYFLSQLSRLMASRFDNAPWTENVQMQPESIVNQLVNGMYDLLRFSKTNQQGETESTVDDGLYEIGKALFMGSGLPLSPMTQPITLLKND